MVADDQVDSALQRVQEPGAEERLRGVADAEPASIVPLPRPADDVACRRHLACLDIQVRKKPQLYRGSCTLRW